MRPTPAVWNIFNKQHYQGLPTIICMGGWLINMGLLRRKYRRDKETVAFTMTIN